tara:strand:- start:2677 stop:3168 length:492 start_codon:yes stop_codon:yes gene_type:complete
MPRVYLSLGSNIDREHNIRSGLNQLAAEFGELGLSPVYESEAVGFSGDAFYNLVASLDTDLPVGELAERLHAIERAHGRVRGEKKFASRTLDIDILTCGDLTGDIDGVELPRGEILKHAFVLRPLADLAPRAEHPVLKRTYAALLEDYRFPEQRLWQVPFVWP